MLKLQPVTDSQLPKIELYSEAVVVSDPCYDLADNIWCMGTLRKVKSGSWLPSVQLVPLREWGERILELNLNHEEYPDISQLECIQCPFVVGVDSGQAGIFDLLAYQNDSLIEDEVSDHLSERHSIWYRACCDLTLSKKQAGTLKGGVVSASGFGDGGYSCYVYLKPLEEDEKPQELLMKEGLIEQGDLKLKTWDPPREIVGFKIIFVDEGEPEEWEDE